MKKSVDVSFRGGDSMGFLGNPQDFKENFPDKHKGKTEIIQKRGLWPLLSYEQEVG